MLLHGEGGDEKGGGKKGKDGGDCEDRKKMGSRRKKLRQRGGV